MEIALSQNSVLIRLTPERWQHILEGHPELVDSKIDVKMAVSNPEYIFEGNNDELLAIREVEPGKWLVVAYREENYDGFIITAFLTRRIQRFSKRRQLWP